MTLTFTLGAGILVRGDPGAARELLVATLGCNIAWGLIDGLMYLAGQRFEQGRRVRLRDTIRAEAREDKAIRLVASELDELLARVTEAGDRESLYRKIVRSIREGGTSSVRLTREDFYGAVASFFLVFLATVPAALPFAFVDDARTALRLSNAILIGLLFVVGYRWARHTSLRPMRTGLSLMVGGVSLVLIAIALGG
jgi:VIT1/CCC1 family predicted Fe2+/Mn2+ transporter